MTGPQTSDALFKNVMATGIIKGDGHPYCEKKGRSLKPVYSKDGHDTGYPQMIKIMLHGHKDHERLHYWGLKMLVDPVE